MSNNTFATTASCPGSNNAAAGCSTSRQARQAELVIGQVGSGGLGVGVIIGLSAADGTGIGVGVGVGVGSQGSSHSR
ncbi:hypothetical protein Tco_0740285 [Tanacetum coccineum]